ncbi:MAG: hypothetical protein KAJ24_04900, partial [Candidatus Aenigmarchaeota archaeon]|nr:hypothetical protein [Candidatus Aenigmarchaeota archaeon]
MHDSICLLTVYIVSVVCRKHRAGCLDAYHNLLYPFYQIVGMSSSLEAELKKLALINAAQYAGKTNAKAVFGRAMGT